MNQMMNADLFAAVFTGLVGIPWGIWLLVDCFRQEQD